MDKPHGNTSNKNAEKETKATAQIQMRVTVAQKNALVSLAQKNGKGLTAFMLDACLARAEDVDN